MQSTADDCHSFPGKRALISFFSWLDYIDQLLTISTETIALKIIEALESDFIIKHLEADINQA